MLFAGNFQTLSLAYLAASRANLSATKNTFDLDVTHWLATQTAPRPVSSGKSHVKSEASINGLV